MLQLSVNKGIELEKLNSHETKIWTVLVYIKFIIFIYLGAGRGHGLVLVWGSAKDLESWFSPSVTWVTGITLVLELTLSGDRHLQLLEPTL